jgi:chorismate mutase
VRATAGGRTVRSRRVGNPPAGAGGTNPASAGASAASANGARSPSGACGLEPFRERLDEVDETIARLLGERFEICRAIALYKRAHEIPMMQPGRVVAVRERYLARGAEVDLPADFTAALFELMIAATCKMEDELIEGRASTGAAAAGAASSAKKASRHGTTR